MSCISNLRVVNLFALMSLLAAPAFAGWRDDSGAAQLTGSGRATWFGIPLYEARLWAGAPPSLDRSFALELTYLRAFRRTALVEESISEMVRLNGDVDPRTRAQWIEQMNHAFADVTKGDRMIGVFLPDSGTRFYHNDQMTAEIHDPLFARLFFAIWLSPNTRVPGLRNALLGNALPARTWP